MSSPPDRFLPEWPPASYSSWVWRSSAWPRGGLYPSSDCPPYPPPLDWLLSGNDRHYLLGIWDSREAVQKSSVLILPSRFALSPAGSSKLQPLRDAPSALVHSIFTPCKLAPWETHAKRPNQCHRQTYKCRINATTKGAKRWVGERVKT